MNGDEGSGANLNDEISKAMAEAEAAVTSMENDDDPPGEAPPKMALEDDAGAGEALRAENHELKEQLQVTKDRWIRAVADLENYKKRVKRETDEAIVRHTQKLLPAFLPVVDNLDRALAVAERASEGGDAAAAAKQIVDGVTMVRNEFLAALHRHGIEPVHAVGKPFDPAMHDALQQQDSAEHPPGTVMLEFEKGYVMQGRLLRPARVIVSGAGSTGQAPAESSESSEP